MEQPSSNLFEGYRSVGNVTGPLPFIVRHGKSVQDTRILTIVGRTIHTYTTNLSLIEVSIPHEHSIKCLTSDERFLYSCASRAIFCWNRGSRNLLFKLENPTKSDIKSIIKFGSNRLISLDEDNVLTNWSLEDKKLCNSISFPEGTHEISTICHPLNYKDKVLTGFKGGQLQLWNIVTEQCIYKFTGWDSSITCITQSPAQDVVGIGLEDGHVYVQNIKYDETIMKIYQEYGSVTSMTFRLDGQPYLVTASEVGHLMIWNLERKRLSSQIRNAHSSHISKCQFVRNESMLVTTGSDNTLKVWTMDMSDGCGTLLSQRAGHSEPPSQIRFYGPKGFNLLSAGKDSTFKMFHMYSERLNRNLGTARWNPRSKKKNREAKKLPSIVCFSAESAKEKQWDNIAACHLGENLISTWNYDKCCMGEHIIQQPSFSKHEVTASSICLSGCGNFVIIGFSNGLIFKYNIQSGIFRQCYENEGLEGHRAHDGKVTGLTVDGLGIVLISIGVDCKMKIWNFKSGILLVKQDFSSPPIRLELHRENNLIAIALENNSIELMDLETRTLIRKFEGPSSIHDMTFSPDSRWLIVSYGDKSIRTWDLSLGKMIDSFSLTTQCTSLSISSTGEFLATAHEDTLSINVWCNYTIYCPTTLRPVDPDSTPPILDMPYVRCDETTLKEDEESDNQMLPEIENQEEPSYLSPEQLNENLITTSGLPSSRWKNLLSLDEIREKQLIEEQEKREKPIKVPFFIPVKDGLRPKLDHEAVEKFNQVDEETALANSKIHNLSLMSPLGQCLITCGNINEYTTFLNQLKELGPSATDAEIRSLGKDTCGDNQAMLCFLDAIEEALKKNTDYELVSSWLALFLKAHSDIIQTDLETCKRCIELMSLVKSSWNRLSGEFDQIFCVLNFVRSSIL